MQTKAMIESKTFRKYRTVWLDIQFKFGNHLMTLLVNGDFNTTSCQKDEEVSNCSSNCSMIPNFKNLSIRLKTVLDLLYVQ
mmetsp:Transcript_1374/g.3432  ORF Transcript_1374/g.3432 Transcript_1374/m.3432 type:complete len:81 (-) Transcript_1374:2065-2307(-)